MLKKLTVLSLFALLISTVPTLAQGDLSSDAKFTQVERIAEAIGLEEIMIAEFRKEFSKSDDVSAAPFSEETKLKIQEILIDRFDMSDFLGGVIYPAIESHFTVQDLTSIADFLESDLGNKLFATLVEEGEDAIKEQIMGGELTEEELVEVMTLAVKLGPKLEKLGETVGPQIETAMKQWGEAFFIETMAEMIDDAQVDAAD